MNTSYLVPGVIESSDNISDFFNESHITSVSLEDVSPRNGPGSEDEPTDLSIFDRPTVRMSFILLYTIVFLFCFFGNLTVVLVVTLHWRMRSITKFCLGNLAFANLCVGIFCVYQNLSTFLADTWIFGRLLCKMYHFTNSLSHTASILILVVMCVERYMAILHPFRFRQLLTITRLRLTIVGVWLVSAILCSPRLYYINTYEIPIPDGPNGGVKHDVICAPQRTLYDSHIADMINFVLLFLFPLGVISFLYARVGLVIWKSSTLLHPSVTAAAALVGQVCPRPPNNSPNSDAVSSVVGSSSSATTSATSTRSRGSDKSFWRSYKVRRFTRRYFRPRLRRRCTYSSPSASPTRHEVLNEAQDERMLELSTRLSIVVEPDIGRCNGKKQSNGLRNLIKVSADVNNHVEHIENRVNNAHGDDLQVIDTPSVKPSQRPPRKQNGRVVCHRGSNVLKAAAASPRLRTLCVNSKEKRTSIQVATTNIDNEETEISEFNLLQPAQQQQHNMVNHHRHHTVNNSRRRIPPRMSQLRLIQLAEIQRKKLLKSRQAVIRLLIAIVVTFAICNLPFHLRKICQYYVRSYEFGSDASYLITAFTFILMYANCAINPILYAFLSKSFRSSLRDVVRLKLRRVPTSRYTQ